jgi:anti-repressor protein
MGTSTWRTAGENISSDGDRMSSVSDKVSSCTDKSSATTDIVSARVISGDSLEVSIRDIDGELYADSRQVGYTLKIAHQSLIKVMSTHQDRLGTIRFEIGSSFMRDGRINPNPEKYALLTERQAMIVLTLVRNSDQAVSAKVALVDAFQAMRKRLTEQPTGANLLALAVIEAHKMLEAKDKQIEVLTPKAEFYDAVTGSTDTIDIGEVAKVLAIAGMGRNNLFAKLRELKVLMENNQPYQKHVDMGHFRTVESKYTKPDGSTHINIKTVVYQRGLDYIRKVVTE